ncbi:polysaccharide deacetylase family protein [Ramlibacter montanisoli]|uniref:Polysaccharide deacetylase family protein n=1 Tax=Ramlibacter montanisoli TaxID=2732512 RepID=A0A849KDW3_9BURK|nr:polysaccharide deacetylase family protein [Ramlibacter montanisoli]NNU43666.1 polysaccharide deacetylase family protein [Ramlibacter montanisoli]
MLTTTATPTETLPGLKALLRETALRALGSRLRVLYRVRKLGRGNWRIVLNLHRVGLADGSSYAPLRPALFDELLVFLTREFQLTTFEAGEEAARKPLAILSFDDGYKDFIEVAAPMLRRHRVRCNHNVIPECIETQRPPLNVLVQDFIGMAPARIVQQLDIPGFRVDAGPALGLRLSAFIKNKPSREQRELADLLLPQLYAWEGFRPTPMMTLEEVRQIAGEHELGAHSYSHASMACETDEYLQQDVRKCQDYFREKLGTPVTIYAFPNGSYAPGQLELVEGAGIRHVLLTGEDFDRGATRHARFTFHAGTSSEVRFRATGGLRPIPE